jgi:carboxymethylenebutenolidase
MMRPLSGFVLACVLILTGCGGDGDASSDTEKMAEGHEGDTPTATEATRRPAIPVTGQAVTYTQPKEGEAVTGYLAAPDSPDSVLSSHNLKPSKNDLPGIVVIHEWWGLNDNVRAATRRLAGEGYRALAVDLYADSTARTPDRAQSLMQQATQNQERLMANIRGAHDYLRSEQGAPRVAVLGWCFGGGMTFRALANRPTAFDAAVAYYGSPEPMTKATLKKLITPTLAHFGRQDQVVPPDEVDDFESRLVATDADVQIHRYDAGHAFANPSGENYDPEAASTAWSRTTAFLRSHLYPSDS